MERTGKKVLLFVEDDPEVLYLAKKVYDQSPYKESIQLLIAVNGIEAIELLSEYTHSKIHAVVTDLNMGDGPDGIAVAQAASKRNIEIIVLNTTLDIEEVQKIAGDRRENLNVELVDKKMEMREFQQFFRRVAEYTEK